MFQTLARISIAVLLLISIHAVAQESKSVSLFDGKSLDGWVQRGGQASYVVEDGAIVGTCKPDTPNSFLCTERDYADFILELDFLVDNELNSGIQIRSQVRDQEQIVEYNDNNGQAASVTIPANRVYGYQVEIDPSDRAYTGGIYDEARRGWLYDLAGDEQAPKRAAFRRNEWNHFRIEARGFSIKTWLNGVPIVDLNDSMDASGFIGLQVHGVDHDRPLQVRWRNIRLTELKGNGN